MSKKKVPKKLQGVLWSVDVSQLDLDKDKDYIIHQIFSYGRMDEILWLFKAYLPKTLKRVFSTTPYKDYRATRFYFVKDYLLALKRKKLDPKLYVKNIPRTLG